MGINWLDPVGSFVHGGGGGATANRGPSRADFIADNPNRHITWADWAKQHGWGDASWNAYMREINGGGGSSGGSAGAPGVSFPDPNAGLLESIRLQQQYAEQERERIEGLAADRLDTSYNNAYDRVTGRFEDRGLDPNQYNDSIVDYLTNIRSTVPIDDLSPGQYFSGDLTGGVVDRITNDQQSGFRNQLNQTFSPGFVDNYFDYNYGQDTINDILSQEQGDVNQYLENAFNRGNTTYQGYQDALGRLTDATSGVQERVGDTARGVIEQYRGQLQGVGDTARQNLSAYQLGDSFDPSQFTSQLDTLYGNLQGSFGGDVRNALGNTPLYDFDAILQRANSTQPASNDLAGNSSVIAAVEERKQREQQRRGVGSAGVF